MKQIYPDLWQTETEHPFRDSPHVATHAYLLLREGGNLLIYSSGQRNDYARIEALGGITHQYLSHVDEAGPPLARIKARFGSKLCCHALEAEDIGRHCPVDLTFSRRETQLGNLEVIPTPGHTPGSTCFFYRSPHGRRYLFTGDTLFPVGESWDTYLSVGGSKEKLRRSLAWLRELEPDVVFSSVSIGQPAFREMAAGTWREIVDQARRALAAGVEA